MQSSRVQRIASEARMPQILQKKIGVGFSRLRRLTQGFSDFANAYS
jgi:hypothetical protein